MGPTTYQILSGISKAIKPMANGKFVFQPGTTGNQVIGV